MVSNKHTCCLCRNQFKDTEIHHIDGDRTNNTVDNLAVVCRDCHSKVTGGRGLGRSYSAFEVKENKRHWEYKVRNELVIVSPRKAKSVATTAHLRTEIRRIIYELAIADDVLVARNKRDLLMVYYVLEAVNETNYILDTLQKVVPLLAENKGGTVAAELVPWLFYHLPDPKEVKITKNDLISLDKAIELLVRLGEFSAEILPKILTPKSCTNSLYELFVTVKSYKLDTFVPQILSGVLDIKEAALKGTKEYRKMMQVVVHAQKMDKKIRDLDRRRK
jgi:HNH endonuclease.